MHTASRQISEKFFADPEWGVVERLLQEYMDELLDMATINLAGTPEEVKAEVKGRQLAHAQLTRFLQDTKLIARKETNEPTTFR
jgi:hypothetical protein